MAQDQQVVVCPSGEWTQLTNADAAAITFQVRGGHVFIRYTEDATQPTEDLIGVLYTSGEGEQMTALSDLSALAAPVRVWARPAGGPPVSVFVDHA